MSDSRYFEPNRIRVCVDRVFYKGFSGRVYSKLQDEPVLFEHSADLLIKTDEMFDKVGFPQAFQKKRSFHNDKEDVAYSFCPRPELYHTDEEMFSKTGELKTLDVVVVSRMRTSWQGIVFLADGSRVGAFQGELEFLNILLKIIDIS